MIYPQTFEIKIEFNKIREILKNYCLSEAGKKISEKMSFSSDISFIETELLQTSEMKNIVMFGENFPFKYFSDGSQTFDRIKNIGSFITEKELLDLKNSLEIVKSLTSFFKNDTENKYPNLKKLSDGIDFFPSIVKEIESIIDKYGNIKDNASHELSEIRRKKSADQSAVSKIMHKILDRAKSDGTVETDCEITVRDGKMLIPVPSAYKRKINGIVYDESATGRTSFIEPFEIIEANNRIRELEFAERREIIKILTQFTNYIRPHINELDLTYNFLADIDFIRAKALFAAETESFMPKLKNKPVIDFINAKHPLLFLSFKKQKREVVSSNFTLTELNRIILISGPNAGGKSVALKTVVLLQYMLQCGMLIPVSSVCETGIFKKIFIDIGDEQSIENDLSTYSSHLLNMKFFTKNADENTLILIDEFGTGTEPLAGGAIAEAVLQELNLLNTKGIITTHYTNLKKLGEETQGIVNAAMLFDLNNLLPLYKLEIGHPGSSFAFEIARKTGISEQILNNAESKLDKNQINFEKVLKQTLKEKRKIAIKAKKIRETEKKLEETLKFYETELDKTISEKKEILIKAKSEAQDILSSANKKIENTIFEIKKSNADKEITKILRKELEDFKTKEIEKRKIEDEKILQKIEKIKNKKNKEKKEKKEKTYTEPLKNITPENINRGDIVKIKGQNTPGEILEIRKNKYTIAFGSIQMNVNADNIEKLSDNAAKQFKKSIKAGVSVFRNEDKNSANFISGLDIRGKRGDEALSTVSDYIDNAVVAGIREIKILHGTGNGILKNLIRDFLRTNKAVKSYADENIQFGGAGITIVKLEK